MDDRDFVLVDRQRRATGHARRRGVAYLVVLLALAASSLASIAVLCDASMEVEEAQAIQEVASRHRATQRVLRIRAAAPATPEAAEKTTASVPRTPPSMPDHASAATRPSSRHAGGRPDLATPQGAKLHDDLVVAARTSVDAKQRAGAVRSLAGMFGTGASDALSGIADDPGQAAEVRDLASKASRRNLVGGK